MRRKHLSLLVVFLLAAAACESGEATRFDEAAARLKEGPLFDFAEQHLSDEDLAAVVPKGFDFLDVNRNGYDRHGNEWVTVGVRIEGPVRFARAIFYVHPDAAHAHEMFERQSTLGEGRPGRGRDNVAEPWTESELAVENRCEIRAGSLFWCHAHRGNVYLLTQSTAGSLTGRNVTGQQRRAASALLRAFGRYLEEEIPKE